MTRRPVPQGTILGWLLGALLVVPLLPLLVACEATPSVRVRKTIPTQALHFSFDITGMYAYTGVTAASDPDVQLAVKVDAPSLGGGSALVLDGGQRLTCDGQTDPAEQRPWRSLTFRLPRRPPGQAYTCVYSDASGVATALAIPVPLGTLAFISPTTGSRIKLVPEGARLPIRYTFPAPPGYVPPSAAAATAAAAASATPLPVATVQGAGSPPPAPDGPTATVQIEAGCGTGTLGPPYCAEMIGPSAPATGSYRLPGIGNNVQGAGHVTLNLYMHWPLPAAGFAGADVQTTDRLKILIRWTGPYD
jgi:hypothetical protein